MVHPITFSIPNEKIITRVNKSKDKFLSSLIPGDLKTYIYNTEEDYYKEYRRSFFAKTKKKGGWDCLRHYEIIANGCLPLFDDIENCPEKTLALFPKNMMKECHEVYENFDEQKYYDLLERVLDYTRENLTTSQMCKYILKKSGHKNVSRILFLSGNIEPDYLRCLTLHGFKETFGKMCHDYPIVPHIYKLENFPYHFIYGKGITYTNLIYGSLHDFEMDKNIIENIKNKFYDVVIYGSYHRGMPQYDLVSNVYKPSEIILLCGEDIHECDYTKWGKKGHHVFVRELS